jgi:hypothetical protein
MPIISESSFHKCVSRSSKKICADSKSEKSDPKLSSERPLHASGRPSISNVQVCIRPDVLATRLDVIQSSRKIQRSSASIRTMWQYRPDASQCSISKRISSADTDMGRQLQSFRYDRSTSSGCYP